MARKPTNYYDDRIIYPDDTLNQQEDSCQNEIQTVCQETEGVTQPSQVENGPSGNQGGAQGSSADSIAVSCIGAFIGGLVGGPFGAVLGVLAAEFVKEIATAQPQSPPNQNNTEQNYNQYQQPDHQQYGDTCDGGDWQSYDGEYDQYDDEYDDDEYEDGYDQYDDQYDDEYDDEEYSQHGHNAGGFQAKYDDRMNAGSGETHNKGRNCNFQREAARHELQASQEPNRSYESTRHAAGVSRAAVLAYQKRLAARNIYNSLQAYQSRIVANKYEAIAGCIARLAGFVAAQDQIVDGAERAVATVMLQIYCKSRNLDVTSIMERFWDGTDEQEWSRVALQLASLVSMDEAEKGFAMLLLVQVANASGKPTESQWRVVQNIARILGYNTKRLEKLNELVGLIPKAEEAVRRKRGYLAPTPEVKQQILNLAKACLILKVEPDCTLNQLRQRYSALISKYHPDSNPAVGQDEAAKAIGLVKWAYNTVREYVQN